MTGRDPQESTANSTNPSAAQITVEPEAVQRLREQASEIAARLPSDVASVLRSVYDLHSGRRMVRFVRDRDDDDDDGRMRTYEGRQIKPRHEWFGFECHFTDELAANEELIRFHRWFMRRMSRRLGIKQRRIRFRTGVPTAMLVAEFGVEAEAAVESLCNKGLLRFEEGPRPGGLMSCAVGCPDGSELIVLSRQYEVYEMPFHLLRIYRRRNGTDELCVRDSDGIPPDCAYDDDEPAQRGFRRVLMTPLGQEVAELLEFAPYPRARLVGQADNVATKPPSDAGVPERKEPVAKDRSGVAGNSGRTRISREARKDAIRAFLAHRPDATQREIAAALGISVGYVNELISGDESLTGWKGERRRQRKKAGRSPAEYQPEMVDRRRDREYDDISVTDNESERLETIEELKRQQQADDASSCVR